MMKWIGNLFGHHEPIDIELVEETNDLRFSEGRLQRRFDLVVKRLHYGWEFDETVSRTPDWRDVPWVSSVG